MQRHIVNPMSVAGRQIALVTSSSSLAALSKGSRPRKPLISFRYLKNPNGEVVANNTLQAPSLAATPASTSKSSSSPALLNLPPSFGRLPPMTPKEAALLHSGLATEEFW